MLAVFRTIERRKIQGLATVVLPALQLISEDYARHQAETALIATRTGISGSWAGSMT